MYDMTIRLQAEAGRYLYEQIYEHIRQEIKEGKLLAGERLPSARSLAEYLQVARSTVDYAYDQLLSEGYIEAKPRLGYFVCTLEDMVCLESHFQPGDKQQQKEAENCPVWEEGNWAQKQISSFTVDFSPNGVDMSGFPFGIWKKINKNILTFGNSELFAQGEPQGDYDLRLTVSRYLHSSRGVNCSPDQIIVGAGNDYLLMLLEKILGRHVKIAMENPTYMRAYRIFQSFAYPVVPVDMDESGMKVSDLEKQAVEAAYVMPSHQFPMGTVMPIGRRMELLRWADGAPGRYLIEDDYDSEFRYRGKPIPSLQASDEHGRVIYMGTFSKSIAPAIRVSYMVLPKMLLARYRKSCSFYSCTVSRIDQRILNEFIRDGYFERHLNKMRKIYRAKHELLLESLKAFEGRFSISGENAGLHLLLTDKKEMAEKELILAAAAQGVRVYGLSESLVKADRKSATVLLGFGGLSMPQITEGTERLKRAWL